MKKNLFFALLLTACFGVPAISYAGFWDSINGSLWGTHTAASPKIDILIVNDQPGAMIEVQGKYRLFDPHKGNHLGTCIIEKKNVIQGIASGLKWGEEFPGIYQIQIVPDSPKTKILVNGVQYPGSLYVYDIGGTVSIVNRVDLEDYLVCTLAKQNEEVLTEETLAASAIVARTFAYFESKNPKSRYWAVDALQVGYHGIQDINTKTAIGKAIQTTNGMVLSLTGPYEGVVTPIAAQWGPSAGCQALQNGGICSRISMFDAEEMSKNGKDASAILSKAFPDAHIELVR